MTVRRLSLSLVLFVAGCASKSAPPVAPRAVRVAIARVEEPKLGNAYAGSLEPKIRVDLAFGVGGRVKALGTIKDGAIERPLKEGDRVSKGTVLALLDDVDLARNASAASLAASAASSELASAQVALAQADADLTRVKKLVDSGSAPGLDLERVDTAHKAAKAKVESAKAQQAARFEQSAIARKAAVDARLVATTDGVIARRLIDAGESVMPSTIAFTLIDASELEMHVAVPETRIAALKVGDAVPIKVEALPATAIAGRVSTIHPVADPALRTFTVELSVENTDGLLRAGMVASATLSSTKTIERLLLVPLASVVRAPDTGLAVFRLDGDRVHLRKVTVGDLVGRDVVVEAGVEPGERIVTDGASFLHEGEQVEVAP